MKFWFCVCTSPNREPFDCEKRPDMGWTGLFSSGFYSSCVWIPALLKLLNGLFYGLKADWGGLVVKSKLCDKLFVGYPPNPENPG